MFFQPITASMEQWKQNHYKVKFLSHNVHGDKLCNKNASEKYS